MDAFAKFLIQHFICILDQKLKILLLKIEKFIGVQNLRIDDKVHRYS